MFKHYLNKIARHIHNLTLTLRHTDSFKIIRRYFLMNSFDAALATFSILFANFVTGISSEHIVILLCLTAGLSMSISGFWGSLFVEQVEQQKQIKKLQKALLTNLEGTALKYDFDKSSLLISLTNGLSPVLVSLLIIWPFLLFPANMAYLISFSLVWLFLIFLGIAMAKIAKTNILYFVLKFLSAVVVSIIIIVMLNSLIS